MIKSIVLTQAIYEQDVRQLDCETAYKEQFIHSIVNKSGVFVKEFREMEDPYTREEFIMSIHMKPAVAEKVQLEQED